MIRPDNPWFAFLRAHKAFALYSAERDWLIHHRDMRWVRGVPVEEPADQISEWLRLRLAAWTAVPAAIKDLWYVCQWNGHIRQRREVGGVRFTCLTCVRCIDCDPTDTSLVIPVLYWTAPPHFFVGALAPAAS